MKEQVSLMTPVTFGAKSGFEVEGSKNFNSEVNI